MFRGMYKKNNMEELWNNNNTRLIKNFRKEYATVCKKKNIKSGGKPWSKNLGNKG